MAGISYPTWADLTPAQQQAYRTPEAYQNAVQAAQSSPGGGQFIQDLKRMQDQTTAGSNGYNQNIKNPFIDSNGHAADSALAQQFQDSWNQSQMDKAKMGGAPDAPKWTDIPSVTNSNGTMVSQLSETPGKSTYQNVTPQVSSLFGANTQVNQQPLRALENYATSTSPSPWLQQALKNNQDLTTTGVNNAAAQSAANTAGAESNLAMRGGLSSGARERVQKAGGSSGLAAAQDVRNTGNTNANNLGLQEEGSKISTLNNLPGAEVASVSPAIQSAEYLGNTAQAQNAANTSNQQFNIGQGAQAQQFNIQNALQQLLQQRGFAANSYNQQMQAFGAGKTADAQAGAGGGGCFITTAVCDYLGLPDDNAILNEFRKFRDEHLGGKSSELLAEYYAKAPLIVEMIKHNDKELARILETYLMPAYASLKQKHFGNAKKIYSKMVRDLEHKYLMNKKVVGA